MLLGVENWDHIPWTTCDLQRCLRKSERQNTSWSSSILKSIIQLLEFTLQAPTWWEGSLLKASFLLGCRHGLVGKSPLLHKHEDLSSNPQCHGKSHHRCTCNPSTTWGWRQEDLWSLLAMSLAAGSGKRLYLKEQGSSTYTWVRNTYILKNKTSFPVTGSPGSACRKTRAISIKCKVFLESVCLLSIFSSINQQKIRTPF